MKLEFIKYVLEIYRSKSINKASEALYLSQPYLSKCLKEVEKELGVSIVTRHSKGVEFTPTGLKFIEYALQIERYTEQIEALKIEFVPSKELLISCFHSFNLIEMIQMANEKNILNNGTLKCIETQNSNVFDRIKNGEAHLGIIYLDTGNLSHYQTLFEAHSLIFVPFHTDFVYAIVNQQHPLSSANTLDKSQLLPYKLLIEQHKLSYTKSNSKRHPLNSYFKEFNTETVQFDNHSSFLYFLSKVKDAFSLGQKRFNTSNPLVAHGELKYIPIIDTEFQLTTGFLYNNKIPMVNEIEQIINYFMAHELSTSS